VPQHRKREEVNGGRLGGTKQVGGVRNTRSSARRRKVRTRASEFPPMRLTDQKKEKSTSIILSISIRKRLGGS